jgi:flagellar biosynthesis protein FlhB
VASDKAFDATPQRLERARREGDLPRTAELGAVAAFASASLAAMLVAGTLAQLARALLTEAAAGHVRALTYAAFGALALAPAAAAGAGALAAFVLAQGRITVRFPALQLRRLDPFAGFKRLCSAQTIFGLLRGCAAAAATGALLAPAVLDALQASARRSDPEGMTSAALAGVLRIVVAGVVTGAVLAAADALLERASWRRRHRMSHAELKRELRQNEADPQVRGRRRRAHGQLVRGSLRRLREATFVIANPTHVAVALEYRPPEVAVPRVVLRALDAGAEALKQRARELDIPIVEDPALARGLFASTRAGEYIPRDSYGAVARVVAALVHAGRRRS